MGTHLRFLRTKGISKKREITKKGNFGKHENLDKKEF